MSTQSYFVGPEFIEQDGIRWVAEPDYNRAIEDARLQGQRDALAQAVQRFDAVWYSRIHDADRVSRQEIIAAIKGDGNE